MVRLVLKILVLFTVYLASAELGSSIDAVSGFASPVWPPAGIALAVLLIFGPRLWPGIFLGAFLFNLTKGANPLTAIGMGFGNTLEALAAVYLLQKFVRFDPLMNKLSDALGFIFFGAVLSPVISATIGVFCLIVGGEIGMDNFFRTWIPWWVGDMMGILIITPLILAWRQLPKFNFVRLRILEGLIISITVFSLCLLIFNGQLLGLDNKDLNIKYIFFPPVIWAALRFGGKATTLIVFFISVIAVLATVFHTGPFTGFNLDYSLISLQIFTGILAVTSLILATLVTEHKSSEMKINLLNSQLQINLDEKSRNLEDAQKIAHVGSWFWEVKSGKVIWSDEMFRLNGYRPKEFEVNFDKAIERIDPEDREKVKKNLEAIFKSALPGENLLPEIIYKIILPDGKVRTVRAVSQLTADENGQPVSLVGTLQDITTIKTAMEDLERLNKLMIGRELKMVELKNKIKELESR